MGDQGTRNKLEDTIQKNLMFLLGGFLLIGIVAAGVVLFSYFTVFGGGLSNSQGVWGQFGDFVGGALNPLFAFLSFIALLMTLLIQNKELVISSEELRKSTEALDQQSKALDLQNFERTFFELVRLHHELVNGMVAHGHRLVRGENPFEKVKHEGRECFMEFCRRFKSRYENVKIDDPTTDMLGRIEIAHKAFMAEAQGVMGHYFRNLYHIYKFVDESRLENKQWYASIIRAQLSSNELWLLFYNALVPGNLKFKFLIEQYAVFENMDLNTLLDRENHMPLYQGTAYGDQAPII